MVRRRPARARASRRGLVGLLIAAITWIGAVAVTASTVAAIGTPVDVVGGGITMSSGFGSPGTSFDIDATDDGTGPSGTFRVMAPFGPNWTGVVTCLSVTGNTAIVGGTSSNPGSIPPEVAVTFMVVDNGPTNDTIVINGPGNIDPPCTPSPFGIAQSLQSGGLTVATGGAAAAGHASGNGTQSLGFGSTTTFAFDADRSARGVVSGTFTFTEGFSSPQTGSVTCLVVTGSTAVIGVLTNGSFGGPFPQPPRHDVWLVSDGGPGGEDTFASDAWSEFGSPDCADPPAAGPAITTGDIVVGAGAVPTPSPTLPPTEGSFGWMSANSQSQPLGGTAFTLSGPGVNLIVTDNGPNDSRPEVGLFAVDHLSIGQTYQVCETTIPADYYATSACQSRTLDGVNGGGFTFFHTFVVALTIDPLGTPPASVERLGRFEARFQLSRFYNLQVFDPAVIDITATFAAPSGRQTTVSAFWMNDYTVRAGTGIGVSEIYDVVPLSPPRPGFWAVRFSPDEVGTYSWSIRAADHQQPGAATVTGPSSTFTVTASSRHGQVGIDPRDSRFLRYEDGTPYVPLGQNAAFEDGTPNEDGTHYYDSLFGSFAAAGENWSRVWMTDFNRSALEWSFNHFSAFYTGVGQYAQPSAWRMDRILDLADQRGLEIQLVLNDHGQFSTWVNARWDTNPYNATRGGPAATPRDFFTNPYAKQMFKQRLHYLVARYGAYRNLLAWELFNEVQYTGTAAVNPQNSAGMASDVQAWHAEMAAYLASIDPYNHLVTTSASNDVPPFTDAIWADPNIDLTQVHDYSAPTGRDATLRSQLSSLQSRFAKPAIAGEFGIGNGDPERHFDPTTSALAQDLREHLAAGTHVHNAAWTGALSRSGAMSWWWGEYDQADPARHRASPDFPLNARVFPALKAYLTGEDWAALHLVDTSITAGPALLAFGQDNGSRGFVWVRDALNEYGTGSRPGDLAGRTVIGETIALGGFVDGTYQVDVWTPYGAGGRTAGFVATASGGTLSIPLPAFSRDIALKIAPGGEQPAAPLVAGGSLTTDLEGDGATPTDPLETTVTTPVAGNVAIAEHPAGGTAPAGYTFFGEQADITAPVASAETPLVLTFRVDGSIVPAGLAVADITVFRNGVVVANCAGPAGQAVPSPCVVSRSTVADDVVIVVRTIQASTWSLGRFDAVAPTIQITSPAADAAYLLGSVQTATYACQDEAGGSGLATCVGPVASGGALSTATAGPHTFTVTATDRAGHTTTLTRTYRVIWPFAIRQPVDALPVVNKAQPGSSVPVKFSLGGDRGPAVLATTPSSGSMTCASGATVDAVEETATSSASGLTYDPATATYAWIWKTEKSWSGTCRQLVLSLADGNVVRFNFTFVK